MKTLQNSLSFDSSDPAQFKLRAIEFSQKYGVNATLDAFEIKRSTFFYWRKKYFDSNKKLVSLVPQSTRPKSVRKMEVDWRLVVFIEKVRQKYGNVGARIIKPFLDEYAFSLSIPSIGRTTIEKVIRRRRLTFEKRCKARRKTQANYLRTRKSPKATRPGYLEADTIEIRIFDRKYYFISIIDIYTRYAYVELIKRQASCCTQESLVRFQDLFRTGENKTCLDYRNKRKLIGLGSYAMSLFGMELPLDEPQILNRRVGTPRKEEADEDHAGKEGRQER